MMVEMFLKTAAAPAVAVTVFCFLFGSAPEPWRSRVQALLFAAGFAGACYLLNGFPPWPPTGGAPSLVYAAFWFALFSWVAPPGSVARYLLRGIWIVVGAVFAVWSLRMNILKSPLQSRNVLALLLLAWGMWSILERSQRGSHPVTALAAGMLSFVAASFLFLFNASLLMCQMMVCLAVMTGGMCVLAWLFPRRLSLHAIFPFIAGLFGVFLISGYIYLDINPWLLIEMAIPFFILLLKDLINQKSKSPLAEAVLTVLAGALPLGYILMNVYKTSGPLY